MMQFLYEDEFLVAIDKPAGWVVHPTPLARDAMACLPMVRDQLGYQVFPVHRLDRGTSGVLLFAKTQEMASRMGELFRTRQIQKVYCAVVRGFTADEMQIDSPVVDAQSGVARAAQTQLRTLAKLEHPRPLGRYQSARFSLVELLPKTGRQHQLRRHMAHIRHPIIGDATHGDCKQNRYFQAEFGVGRLLLFACELRFFQPYSGLEVTIKAPLIQDLSRIFTF